MFLVIFTSRAVVMVSTSTPRRKRSIRPVTAASHAEQNTKYIFTFLHTGCPKNSDVVTVKVKKSN